MQNGFGTELTLDTSPLMTVPAEHFDLVLANLDRRTLLELRDLLARCLHRSGRLIVSGVLSGDRADVVDAFNQDGGTLTEEYARDGWLAMAFTFHREAPI
jgi:ribosomal protein L11 methylase PrmA